MESCLDSILAQQCPFAYEVLLGEDDSSDGTRAIAQRYAAEHPDRIRLFLHRRDQMIRIDGRPTGRHNFLNNLRHARGRYLCHIDGDDYWPDPQRLRIMVEKMEAEPDLGLAFHNAMNVWDDGREQPYFDPAKAKPRFPLEELTEANFIPTSGVIWRWEGMQEFPEAFRTAPSAIGRSTCISRKGPIGYVDRIMSVRRVHEGGIMSVMGELRTMRGIALAYEVMHGQATDRLAPAALVRWAKQITDGFDARCTPAIVRTPHGSLRMPGACRMAISASAFARWWLQLHFPRLMRAYGAWRKGH
ncbi:MAG: glycosyltransferase family 2 protein [Flavobacteriales bacterium]|nr:glycosyltransferase family 2 protein [Flavobacteriales bacterium]